MAQPSIPSRSRTTPPAPSANGGDLVAQARATRLQAESFAAAVRRYSEVMPTTLDRLHDCCIAIRLHARDIAVGR